MSLFAEADTLEQARIKLAAVFSAAGKEPAALEARLLMEEATGLSALGLVTHADRQLDRTAAMVLQNYASRRVAGEPVSRILGRSGFFGLDLLVDPDVLDPRADTETLVNTALGLLERKKLRKPRILDLGVGSGAILCALLDARADAFGVGVDISEAACDLTLRNLARCGLTGRSGVVRGDWTSSLNGGFDLVVSNPPYLAHTEIPELEPEVRSFDPILALDGGVDGLGPYRRIAPDLERLMRSGGIACFEIGWRQGADVTAILAAEGFNDVEIARDAAGRDRVVAVQAS